MHSIRTKITLLTVCVTLIAVIAVTLLSVVSIRTTEQQKTDQLLLLLCESGGRNLDYYFSSVEKAVRKTSLFVERDLDGLEDEKLRQHMRRVSAYFDEMAHKTNGVLTYYYRIDPEISETVKGFWFIDLDGEGFVEHEVTDITLYDTQDTSKLVWFTVPKYTGDPVWLSPYITDNLDVRVISYNVPIYYRGRFVGVIGIEIDYTMMAEQVKSIELYSNGYAYLNDEEGNLIYHPRIDVASLPEEELPKVPEGVISDSTFIRYTFEGVKKEAAWLRLSNGFRLNVAVPEDEADVNLRRLIWQIIIVSGAVVIALCAFILYLTGKITKPLQELTEAARQVDQGNYDFALDYNKDDEVGRLTKTFKVLVSNVKEHINELNRRVNVDALTSVRNKGAFAAYLEELQKKIDEQEGKTEVAIGVFDCDDLKTVNDRYGHDKGDIYLKTASRLICRVYQHSPVFRIGGDEFAVVLQNNDLRNMEALSTEFQTTCSTICAGTSNLWEQVHVAMGIAVYDPNQDQSIIETVQRADKIMYANKRTYKEKSRTNS